jgi:hypothetical protein
MRERTTKYNLHWTDINKFKGKITEKLVRQYIEKVLIPALGKEGWEHYFDKSQRKSLFFGFSSNMQEA